MIFIIVLLIVILFGFKIINKSKEINIEKILEHGELKYEDMLKGDIFYKSPVKDKDGNISYLTYIRLEDGKEITVEKEDFYSLLNIGDVISCSKKTYIYKSQKLSFYTVLLDKLDDIRLSDCSTHINAVGSKVKTLKPI